MRKSTLGILIILFAAAGAYWGFKGTGTEILPLLLPIARMFFSVVSFVAIPLFCTSIVSSVPVLIRSKALLETFVRVLFWILIVVVVVFVLFAGIYYLFSESLLFGEKQRDAVLQLVDPIDNSVTVAPPVDTAPQWTSPLERFISIVPDNIFVALVSNNFISIIFFSLIFGAVLGMLRNKTSDFLINLFDSFHAAFTKIFRALLYIFPPMLAVVIADFMKTNIEHIVLLYNASRVFVVYMFAFLAFLFVMTLVLGTLAKKNVFRLFFTSLTLGLLSFAGRSSVLALPGIVSFFERRDDDRKPLVVARFSAPLLLAVFSVGFFVVYLAFTIFSSYLTETPLSLFKLGSIAGRGLLFSIGGDASGLEGFEQLFALQGTTQELLGRIFEIFHSLMLPLLTFISATVSFFVTVAVVRFATKKDMVTVGEGILEEEESEEDTILEAEGESVPGMQEEKEDYEAASVQEAPVVQEMNSAEKKKFVTFFSIPLRLSFITIITVLLVSYALLTGLVNYQGGRYSALSLAEITLRELIETTKREVASHFEDAEVSAEHARYVLNTRLVDSGDFESLTTYFTSGILEQNKDIVAAYVGTPDGKFFMSKRMSDGTLSLAHVRQEDGNVIYDWTHENEFLEATFPDTRSAVGVGYDPRVRPWYKRAVETGEAEWVSVYIFASEKILGVTYAYPLYSEAGSFYGVAGFDIGLADLSEFLAMQTLLPSDRIFLFEEESEELVALSLDVSNAASYLYEDNPDTDEFDPQRTTVYESEDDILREVYATFKDGDSVRKIDSASFLTRVLFGAGSAEEGSDESSSILSRVSAEGKDYFVSFSDVPIAESYAWRLGFIVSEDELLEYVDRNNLIQILVTIATFIIVIIIGSWFAKKLTTPLLSIAADMGRVRQLIIQDVAPVSSFIREINEIDNALVQMKQGLSSFKKYVPSDLVLQLLKINAPAEVGGQHRELSLFFSDIEGFTGKSEGRDPGTILVQLSDYFELMTNAISESGGTIDKYIGDSIMGFWGAPNEITDHATRACIAAVRCQKRLTTIRDNPFHTTRIGLHTGKVLVGNMGSAHRINYTVLGDEVNLASRIEGLNKFYQTRIIISESCYEQAKDVAIVRFLDQVTVKGRTNTTVIYELLGLRGEDLLFGSDIPAAQVQEFLALYWEASRHYRERAWGKAASCFARAYKIIPTDRPVKLLYARSYHFYHNPPPDDWSGTVRIDVK